MNYGADPKELARRVRREIMRREQVTAFALSGNRRLWTDVLKDLGKITCNPDISPIRIVKQLNTYFHKFDEIRQEDRAFMVLQSGRGKRNFSGWLMTVAADTHPLVDNETCLVVRATTFHMGRRLGYARDSFLAALSTHALARIQERSNFTVDNVIDALLLSGMLAMHLSVKLEDSNKDSEIMVRFEDTVLAGAIRLVGDPRNPYANHMIDYRTALDANTLTDEQLARADAAGLLAFDLFEGRPNDTVLDLPAARTDWVNTNATRVGGPVLIPTEASDESVLLRTGN